MKVWYCEEHRVIQSPDVSGLQPLDCWFWTLRQKDVPPPCRMVPMRLISDNEETEELMAQAIGRNQWEELPVSDKDMNAFRSDVKAILAALDGVTP